MRFPRSRIGDLLARRGAIVLSVLVASLIVAGCSSSPPAGQASIDPSAVRLVASGVQFITKEASAPADKPFQIAFESQTSEMHDLVIAMPNADPIFRSAVFAGPTTKTFAIEPLAAGSYIYRCDVHPGMQGILTVK